MLIMGRLSSFIRELQIPIAENMQFSCRTACHSTPVFLAIRLHFFEKIILQLDSTYFLIAYFFFLIILQMRAALFSCISIASFSCIPETATHVNVLHSFHPQMERIQFVAGSI